MNTKTLTQQPGVVKGDEQQKLDSAGFITGTIPPSNSNRSWLARLFLSPSERRLRGGGRHETMIPPLINLNNTFIIHILFHHHHNQIYVGREVKL